MSTNKNQEILFLRMPYHIYCRYNILSTDANEIKVIGKEIINYLDRIKFAKKLNDYGKEKDTYIESYGEMDGEHYGYEIYFPYEGFDGKIRNELEFFIIKTLNSAGWDLFDKKSGGRKEYIFVKKNL